MEARLGVPTFLWASGAKQVQATQLSAAKAQPKSDIESAARDYLGENASLYRLSSDDVAVAGLVAIHDTGKGVIIAKFKQDVGGIEVFREEINVVMSRDLQLVALTGYLTGDGAQLPAQDFNLGPAEALSKALEDLTGMALAPSALRGKSPETASGEKANPYTLYTGETGIAQGFTFADEPSRVKKVMFHLPDGYVPAYYVEAFVLVPSEDATLISVTGEPLMTELGYSYVISAVDGQLLFRNNLIDEDGEFTYRVWADPVTKIPYDTPAGNGPHPKLLPLPDGAQEPFVPQNEVTLKNFPFSKNDPWLAPGATDTNGNNVDAFVNLVNAAGNTDNGYGPVMSPILDTPTGDHRALISASNSFLYTNQPDADAFSATARQGSITQLFYNINFLHDWFYDSGFDEASGNAQKSNYGRGGLQNDDIRAQAQDTASFSNANMLTPADGSRPRMRMYNFPNPANMLDVQAPAGIQSKLKVGISQTGRRNFDVTSDVVIATFSNSPSACTITNAAALAGKIAMFDFDNTDGTGCAFGTRITRIHATGAAAALMVYNSAPANANSVANITGLNATHTKPVAVISWNSAAPIKTQLNGGNTVTARLLRMADRDGAIDNQIVAHEWGHYISGRLIGNGNGLNNQQGGGMGEGWGDFLAMLLTVRADDTATPSNATWGGLYAIATYTTGGEPFSGTANHGYYLGTRRTPYSTDMTNYNALTFKHIEDGVALPSGPPIATGGVNSQVHNTGEVWATMLWECYAALLRDTQGPTPRLSFNEAQTRMKNYLVAGFKMTPASPTFLEARDAVLVAAFTYDYQDGLLFAQAFAKRGAGLNAVAPDRFSLTNAGVVESFEAGGALTYIGTSLDDSLNNCDGDGYLDNNEEGLLKVTIKNAGFQNLYNTTATVSSNNPHVTFPEGATINFSPMQPGQSVTASTAVKVVGATGVETSDFTITFQDTGSPAVASTTVHFFEYLNADESASVTATDNVEPRQTNWTESSNPSFLNTPAVKWQRAGESNSVSHFWFVADPDGPSDQLLTSPVMTVDGSGSVNVQFDHSWAFEFDTSGNYDGGVVEMSVNGGSWTDIGGPAYNGVLINYSGNQNTLKTRQAFVKSSGIIHTSLTQAIAPGSTVQIRFRFGSDNLNGGDGWRIDNIAFTGVVETPFRVLDPETSVCGAPTPSTGTTTILFSPDALPAATVGEAYTTTITPSGGTAPYTFNVTPVVMPQGLSSSVSGNTVQISGTPAHVGTSLVKVTATDANSNQGSKTFTLTINKANSTTTVTVSNAVYDGNPHGGTATVAGVSGLNQSLTVTYTGRNSTTYGPSTMAPTIVGEYAASATYEGDAYHNGSSDSKDFQITKASQTIAFGTLADETFGNAPFNVSAAGGGSSSPVTYAATGNCTSGGVGGASITITGAGSCIVTASQAGDINYNAAADVARSFNIAKATATTTLGDLSHTYDGSAKAAKATTSPAGLSIVSISYKQNGVDVAAPAGAGSYDVTASLSNADYQAADATGTLVIAKASQTITFEELSNKSFGDIDFSVSAESSSDLAVSFDAAGDCSISGSTVHITRVGSCTIRAFQDGDSNYNAATSVARTFSIAKADQTITFGALSGKIFTDADFTLSATTSSSLAVSFAANGQCTVMGNTVHLTGAGSCTITASQAGDNNYNATTPVQQTFSIAKGNQTITFNSLAGKTYGGPPFLVNATASSGLAVSFSSQASSVCAVTGNSVTLLSAGTCTIRASQAGDGNYNGAPDFDQSFTVAKADQTITFGALSNKTFGDADFAVTATASSGLPVSFAASGSCTVSGATAHITGAGSCTITASQSGNSDYNVVTSATQSFGIAKAAAATAVTVTDATYDGNPHGGTANVTGAGGLSQTVAVSYTGRNSTVYGPSTTAPTDAGDYTASAGFAGNPNYQDSSDSKDFRITKSHQTITFGALADKILGDEDFTVSATASSGLSVSYSASGQCTVTGSLVHLTGAGSCQITASQSGNSNFNAATNVQQSVQISKADTTASMTSSVNPAESGQDVTFTATVTSSSGTPTGTVTFKDNGSAIPSCTNVALSSGQTTCTINNLTAGNHTITADYNGDSNFNPNTGTLAGGQQVNVNASISINDISLAEGHSGTTNFTFTVTLSQQSNLSVTVDFATIDTGGATGATDGIDYTAQSGTLTFDPGQTTKTITVAVTGDTIEEQDEKFSVNLSNAQNATVSDNQGAGTILNDDSPTVQFSAASYQVSEGANSTPQDFTTISVEAVRTGDMSKPASVRYTTSDQSGANECDKVTGFASQRCDYTLVGATLRFAAGESSKTIIIPITNDGYKEGDDVFTIQLQNPVGASLGSINQATITISDDLADNTPPSSAENPYLSNEFFVRQDYLDNLGREADQAGFTDWTNVLNNCGPQQGFLGAPKNCDRAHVAHGFFGSEEFITRGFLLFRLYEVGMGRLPLYREFIPDMATLSGFGIPDSVRQQNLLDYLQQFANEPEFVNRFQSVSQSSQATQLIEMLEQTAGVTLPGTTATLSGQPPQYGRSELIQKRQSGQFSLIEVIKAFVEQKVVYDRYFTEGEVTMMYFVYLRRDPSLNDPNLLGWKDWVQVFTNGSVRPDGTVIEPRDIHHLIFGFIYSEEYRKRFGQP